MKTETELLDEIKGLQADLKYSESELRDAKGEIRDLEDKVGGLKYEIDEILNADPEPQYPTLNDQTKYDFFIENFDKITLEQLENLVK